MDIGSAVSRGYGTSEEQLRDLAAYKASDLFSPVEKLVLEYAEAMTGTPVAVGGELFAALQRHLSAAQLVEITAVIAWENFRARFNHACGIEAQGFSEGGYCVLPARAERHG